MEICSDDPVQGSRAKSYIHPPRPPRQIISPPRGEKNDISDSCRGLVGRWPDLVPRGASACAREFLYYRIRVLQGAEAAWRMIGDVINRATGVRVQEQKDKGALGQTKIQS